MPQLEIGFEDDVLRLGSADNVVVAGWWNAPQMNHVQAMFDPARIRIDAFEDLRVIAQRTGDVGRRRSRRRPHRSPPALFVVPRSRGEPTVLAAKGRQKAKNDVSKY